MNIHSSSNCIPVFFFELHFISHNGHWFSPPYGGYNRRLRLKLNLSPGYCTRELFLFLFLFLFQGVVGSSL